MNKISEGEKNFVNYGIKLNIRADGRKTNQSRNLFVEEGNLPQANGSFLVSLPDQAVKIFVGIKVFFPNLPK